MSLSVLYLFGLATDAATLSAVLRQAPMYLDESGITVYEKNWTVYKYVSWCTILVK